MEDKQELRRIIKERSKALTDDYREHASADIATRVILHPTFQRANTVFCYVSMPTEPDTNFIINSAWQMGKHVYVPKCLPGNMMKAVEITSFDDLESGTMGILEPREGLPEIDAYKIDFAVIPCVSADRFGHRLGHGDGYYDKFLSGLDIYKCCLCFGELMLEAVPITPMDALMNRVVTEEKLYNPRLQSEDIIAEIKKEETENGHLDAWRQLFSGLFHRKK